MKQHTAFVTNERGAIVSHYTSLKRDKAIRVAARRAPANQGVLTIHTTTNPEV
jgi:hypothetical protein